MFFCELQNAFDERQKAKARMFNHRKGELETVAEAVLLPIIEKNFVRQQQKTPASAVLILKVYTVEDGDIIYIRTADDETKYFEYNLTERAKKVGIELEYFSKTLLDTLCEIAPRIHPGFEGCQGEPEETFENEFTISYVFKLKFTTLRYLQYISTL